MFKSLDRMFSVGYIQAVELLHSKSQVGDAIRSRRAHMKLNQEQAGKMAGIARQTVGEIEDGEGTTDKTMKLARALGFDRMTLGHFAEVLWPMGAE